MYQDYRHEPAYHYAQYHAYKNESNPEEKENFYQDYRHEPAYHYAQYHAYKN